MHINYSLKTNQPYLLVYYCVYTVLNNYNFKYLLEILFKGITSEIG